MCILHPVPSLRLLLFLAVYYKENWEAHACTLSCQSHATPIVCVGSLKLELVINAVSMQVNIPCILAGYDCC